MNANDKSQDVSIRFTLTLEDGSPITTQIEGDRFDYSPGEEQIMPALEEALEGAKKGEKRQFVLSPQRDPQLKLDVSRLAHILGHPGETLLLEVEVL